jgi:phosphatidylglycerol---prolipoprotein diacylglyceryl transferase
LARTLGNWVTNGGKGRNHIALARIALSAMTVFVIPYPIIDPAAVHIGPLQIRWYALAYIGGLAGGWIYARLLLRNDRLWNGRPHPRTESIADLVLYCALGIIIGGRLGDVLFYEPDHYFAHPLEILQLWNGGMAFHGGLIGAALAIWYFARETKIPVLTVGDICAAAAPIGIFLVRIANFINEELWGRPTDVAWAIIFPDVDSQPRHPSQLYEACQEGLLLFLVLAVCTRGGALRRPGLVTGIFCIGYGAARIFSEFFREPDPQLEQLSHGLTMGMVLSAPILLIGIVLVYYAFRVTASPGRSALARDR